MSLAILGVLVAAEIVLTVLTLTKFRNKAKWLQNRLIVRGAEAAFLLGIVVLPTTYLKWRFMTAILVLLFRVAVAGIQFLVRRKKAAEKTKKIPGTIIGCVVSVGIITISLTPALMFANYNGLPTTGDYQVKQCSAILIDHDRVDEFEDDGSYREVPVHFYYPETEGNFPLIVFSHGAFGYYQSNFSTYAELASNGYVVAALDHPHHALFTTDSEGKTILVDNHFFSEAMETDSPEVTSERLYELSQKWMKLRTDDGNFVLDTIEEAKKAEALDDAWCVNDDAQIMKVLEMTDVDHIGLIGHSMGGAMSVALGRERSDIDAVVDLDGTMLGEIVEYHDGRFDGSSRSFEYNREPYPVPVLDFTKASDYNDSKSAENNAYLNQPVMANAKDGRTVVVEGVGHMDFTDMPVFSPFLASLMGSGDVDHEQVLMTMNGIVLNWFDYYLKGEGVLNTPARF